MMSLLLLVPLASCALSMDGLTSRSVDLGRGQPMTVIVPEENDDAENLEIAAILGVDTDVVKAQRAALSSVDNAEGQKLWPSSIALARMLTKSSTLSVRDLDVIEIGSGLGVAGVAAALAGARSVLLTDFQPRSLELAEATAKANGVADIVRTHLLDWTAPGDLSALGTFDVVLGSDVLYDQELTRALVPNVIAPLLLSPSRDRSRPESRALLVDPPLRPSRAMLPELCAGCGLYWGGELPVAEAEEPDTVAINILRA